ncbi:MAG TPA: NAD(P)/FAD-dependent oxidoreductase [Stellaceae bacterium]|nr:NAD(P)/FAD-dependent oxidoreductase [Stellaceae bacterium]
MANFDGIIIGAGHNGLTLGAYMSRAGLKVCVLECAAEIGGGCSTAEPILPGFRCNLHSNFYIAWANAPLSRDLELHRHGFATIVPPVQQGLAARDGTALVIHTDIERSCASIARFSRRDAATYRELHELYAVRMQPLFASLMYNPPLAPEELRDHLSGAQGQALLAHAKSDFFTVVDRTFEDQRLRALFKILLHAGAGENQPGMGMAFPSMISALTGNALPVGGSISLPRALARVIAACGGTVVTNADVREISVRDGRARGVRLADGTVIEADRFVASSLNAPATMALAGEDHFPDAVRQKLKDWQWGHHSLVTLHLALKAPPDYAAARFDADMNRAFNVLFGFDDDAAIERYFERCRRGEAPDRLMGNGACHSLFDPTYAPAGRHVAFWYPFAPYALTEGPEGWDRQRDHWRARLLDEWREFAPNLGNENVLVAYVYTPADIPRFNANMVNGSLRMGAFVPAQLGVNRPHPALADYRTPIEGFYLCGSSNHGGGANGAPGYNAANIIAADLRLATPWTPVAKPEWH